MLLPDIDRVWRQVRAGGVVTKKVVFCQHKAAIDSGAKRHSNPGREKRAYFYERANTTLGMPPEMRAS